MLSILQKLWRGELPLQEAFWRYFITYDLIFNLAATFITFVFIIYKAPIILAAVTHFLPLPYTILAATGTWRSADRAAQKNSLAHIAKLVIVMWVVFWLVF